MATEIALQDIEPILDFEQARCLEIALGVTPVERRVRVAVAFTGLSVKRWADLAGLEPWSVMRWLDGRSKRLPLGSAYRLAAVMGVEMPRLFWGHINKDG